MNLQIFYWAVILIVFFGTLDVLRRPAGKTKETVLWLMHDLFLLAVLVAFWPDRSKIADPTVFALGVVGIILRVVIRVRLHKDALAAAPVAGAAAPGVDNISRQGRKHDRGKRRRTR
ncbi:MAG TPA: hypothetical protein VHR86_06410 [Armatimonadota bacterium]|nr:hypothetical protein [Armatimonadota bacterium]